jgi:hypothetical protein
MDLRYNSDWASAGYCNQAPMFDNFGIADANLLKPGDADKSIIPLRLARKDIHRMPPLGVNRVDDNGVLLIQNWINALDQCP